MRSHRWAQADRPLVFGHRGGSRLAPENTLAAFDRGVREGVDGLELDVRLSRDGEVVVCHDATIDRTTDGTGAVSAWTAAELSRMDAGSRFATPDSATPYRGQGIGVPMLRDVLGRYPDRWLIVEMKDDGEEVARAVLDCLRRAEAVDRTCLGSFHTGALRAARRLEPRIATGASRSEVLWAVIWCRLGWLPPLLRYDALQVPEVKEGIRVVRPRLIRAAHRAGIPVQVWIVDDGEDIVRLLSWGVDAIITDRPDIAVATLRARR